MKLILTTDVDKLSVAGDIVEVKASYGHNYLLPHRLAIIATHGTERQIEGVRRTQEARTIRNLDHAREVKQKIDSLDNVSVTVKVLENGKLSGSITRGNITDAIRKASGQATDEHVVMLTPNQIRSFDKHTVDIALHPQITVYVSVQVVTI